MKQEDPVKKKIGAEGDSDAEVTEEEEDNCEEDKPMTEEEI